jgi:hypothetical protein
MILVISIYKISNQQRFDEIKFTLKQNLLNKFIKKIIIIDEYDAFSLLGISSKKVLLIPVKKRLTISQIVKLIRSNHENHLNHYFILSNNDIIFNNSLKLIKYYWFNKLFIVLTRYEMNGELFRSKLGDSSDTWITKGLPYAYDYCDFHLGVLGVENRMSFEFYIRNFTIINPSKAVKCLHVHNSNFRTYQKTDRYCGYYLNIIPSNFFDTYLINIFRLFINKFSKISIIYAQK